MHPPGRLDEHGAKNGFDLVELVRPGDQWRRELNHGVSPVISAADQPPPVQGAGQKAPEQSLGLLVGEGLLARLVLDELDRVEVASAADVADDWDVAQRLEHGPERRLMLAN